MMNRKNIILTIAALLVIGGLSLAYVSTQVISQPPTGPIESKDAAIARMTNRFANMAGTSDGPVDADQIHILDARLLRHAEAYQVMNGGPPIYHSSKSYGPDTLIWVVSMESPFVDNLPMFAQGPLEYRGATFTMNAETGDLLSISSFSDFENDFMMQKVLQMESLEDTVDLIKKSSL